METPSDSYHFSHLEVSKQWKHSWRSLYCHYRIQLIRAVSIPALCNTNNIPLIQGRTSTEILFVICLATGIIGVSVVIGPSGSGTVLDIVIAITVLLGLRHNILSLLLGIPFERAIAAHKILGIAMIGVLVIHALIGLNSTGIALLTLLVTTCLSYILKPYFFEIFYYYHILAYCAIIPVTIVHGALWTPIAGAVWIADLIVRYIICGKKINASIVKLPGGVVRIHFPKCFDYEPGQYCFIRIHSIDTIEYHPFSVSSAPLEKITSFHVRALGDWSNRLMEMASTTDGLKMDIHIEGPYGSPAIELFKENYEVQASQYI